MDKMTKRDCINYCANRIKEMWEKYGKPTDFDTRHAVYENCKKLCEFYGYTGMCFVDIWNKASRKAHSE